MATSCIALTGSVWIAATYFHPGGDLAAEWLTARAVIDGVNPYQSVADLGALYGIDVPLDVVSPRTPAALLLSVPLGWVPFSALPIVGVLGVVFVLAITAWILFGHEGLWGLPLFLLTYSGAAIAAHGHVSMAILGLCAAVFIRRDSGAAAAVAASLKLFPALWFVALGLAGKWRAFWTAVAVFLGLNVLGLIVLRIEFGAMFDALFGIRSMAFGHSRNGSLLSVGVPFVVVTALGLAFLGFWPRRSILRAALPASILLGPIGWIDYMVLVFSSVSRRWAGVMLVAMVGVRVAGAPSQSVGMQVLLFSLSFLAVVGFERVSGSPNETKHSAIRRFAPRGLSSAAEASK